MKYPLTKKDIAELSKAISRVDKKLGDKAPLLTEMKALRGRMINLQAEVGRQRIIIERIKDKLGA